MKHEKGFSFYEFPCASGEPKALVVILHGYGSHPMRYKHLAQQTQKEYPDADVLVVRGPIALKASKAQKAAKGVSDDDLYSWFRVEGGRGRQTRLLLRNVFNRMPVVDKLNRFLDHQLKKRKLQTKDLALTGFSMGGSVAMYTAARRKETCAAVVSHSGTTLPVFRARSRPEALILMGDGDEIFFREQRQEDHPVSKLIRAFRKVGINFSLDHEDSVRRVRKAGLPVREVIVHGLGHNITDESWGQVSSFVVKNLKKRGP